MSQGPTADDGLNPPPVGRAAEWCADLTLQRDPVLRDFRQLQGKIVVFGGSFDPPRYGHLNAALAGADELEADSIIFLPCWIDGSKSGPHASPIDRVRMIALMIQSHPDFYVSPFELEQSKAPYTIDTLKAIRESIVESAELHFLVGGDALERAHRWHRIDEYHKYCTVKILPRSDQGTENLEALRRNYTPSTWERLFSGLLKSEDARSADSSSWLRLNLTRGEVDFNGLVPEAVADYIKARGLYALNSSS